MADVSEQFEISPEFCEAYCDGKAWPLPRQSVYEPVPDKYEVLVAGAGPAGLFLTLLLNRYGLNQGSVLCVDPKTRQTDIGHADGFNARTLEILATLGLDATIRRDSFKFVEMVNWMVGPNGATRESVLPFNFAPTRFCDCVTIHQGRFERVLRDDLARYNPDAIHYCSAVEQVSIDESDPEYPVRATVRFNDNVKTVRAKYAVAADGAHSVVRRSLGIAMQGDTVDEIWGVVDFVPDTDFPDVRRTSRMITNDGTKRSAFLIPREKMSNGDWLVRVYINVSSDDMTSEPVSDDQKDEARRKKAKIKRDHILDKIEQVWQPFRLQVKAGTKPVWWATYAVGQRLADRFITEDSQGHPRVFLVGDACHTHSPQQGQGLNISTYDSYSLAWRLAYVLMGLSHENGELLRSYEIERRIWAEKVVTADKRWNQGSLNKMEIMEDMRQQVTGCGVEEPVGLLVSEKNDAVAWQATDLLSGTLRCGRRLLNTRVTRWADSCPIDIHDDFSSDGKYRILLLASEDFPRGRSQSAVEAVCSIVDSFVEGLVEGVFLQPWTNESFQWADTPPVLKQQAEMRLHIADETVYQTYRVDRQRGAAVLVRPDGIVAMTTELEDIGSIHKMLQRVLTLVKNRLPRRQSKHWAQGFEESTSSSQTSGSSPKLAD